MLDIRAPRAGRVAARHPDSVAERAAGEQQRREGDDVGVDHPLQVAEVRPRSSPIAGRATFRIVTSRMAAKKPSQAANRTLPG